MSPQIKRAARITAKVKNLLPERIKYTLNVRAPAIVSNFKNKNRAGLIPVFLIFFTVKKIKTAAVMAEIKKV